MSLSDKLIDHDAAARLDGLVKAAMKAGADAADAVEFKHISAGIAYRLGKLEDVGRSESSDLGLRVFVGKRVAFVSSTDFSEQTLSGLPARAVSMARLAPEDTFAGLAPHDLLATEFCSLDIDDAEEPPTTVLVERARDAEAAALAVQGVTNSEGGAADYGRTIVTLATSEGFLGGYAGTSSSISVSVIAGEGTGMEGDYAYTSTRHRTDLEAPEDIGKRAATRAVKRLNPRKVSTQTVPILEELPTLIERDEGFCCWYCKIALTLKTMVFEHLNGNRSDHRIENKVLSCQSCNIKKIYDSDMQILAKEKLVENEKKIFVRERKFEENTESPKPDSEIDINLSNFDTVEQFLSERITTDGEVLFKNALNSCTYICKERTRHGSQQAIRNYIDTLTCEVAPYMIIKDDNGKKTIVKRNGN